MHMEDQSRPYSIARVTDARARDTVWVKFMQPSKEDDPLGSSWTDCPVTVQ